MGIEGAGTEPDQMFIQVIAAELSRRKQQFVDDLVAVTRLEILDLNRGDELASWLVVSISENTDLLVDVLFGNENPREATTPNGALDYAVRLARANVPLPALLRAYRVGQMMFTEMCLEVAGELEFDSLPVLRDLVARVAVFIDHVSEVVQAAYSQELARLSSTPLGLRQQWIARLLADGNIDVDRAELELEYPLRGSHLGVELWSCGSIDAVVEEGLQIVSMALGGPPWLSLRTGDHSVQAWFATTQEPDHAAVRKELQRSGLKVRLAFGAPSEHLSGFRRTSALAARTKRLAAELRDLPPSVTSYREVEAVALLRDDPIALREFVERTLGPLAVDDERERGLRDTLLVFLECNQMPGHAADRLMVHRNTVRYRVDQAIAIRGRPIDVELLDLMLALAVTKWFGSSVLSPS